MTVQAKKGGEVGANGEFYKGGQWMNLTPENPKNSHISKPKTKRQKTQVAPYEWVVLDEGQKSIFNKLSGFCTYKESCFGAKDWKVDQFNGPALRKVMTVSEYLILIDRFNRGDRIL